MRKLLLAFVPAMLFAACSHDHDHGAGSGHALAGGWVQDTGSDAKGFGLTFNTGGADCELHTANRPDGSHDHLDGTYTFDAAGKTITVKVKLLGDGKADSWTGTVAADRIELTGGADKVALKRGAVHH